MKKRIISGTIFASLAIAIIIIGGYVLDSFLLILSGIGIYEIYNAFIKKGLSPIKLYGVFFLAILACMLYFDGESFMSILIETKAFGTINLFPPLFLISIMSLLSLLVFKHNKYNFIDLSVTVFGGLYVVFFISYFAKLRDLNGGVYLFFVTLIGAVAADTFAYFVGSAIGKKKLIPAVSPKKTVAGSVSGFFGSVILLSVIGFVLIKFDLYTGMQLFHYPIIGVITGSVAQIGDLVASSIKRYTGIKDFGKLIPGHGGILDRIDSYLFVVPVVYYYLLIFGIGGV